VGIGVSVSMCISIDIGSWITMNEKEGGNASVVPAVKNTTTISSLYLILV
jgi:hypothetical protein